jgi:predicted DNA binding protein
VGIQNLTRELGTKIIRKTQVKSNVQMIIQHCGCDNIPPPTLPVIERRNCLELQPATYTGGWEWYRILAFSSHDIRNLFRDLDKHCTVEVVSRRAISEESVRDTFLLSSATLAGGLTTKQLRALITALDNGYYRFPRSSTAGEIAERAGLPRTSFTDHLRKAENKVLLAVAPYLRLRPERDRRRMTANNLIP